MFYCKDKQTKAESSSFINSCCVSLEPSIKMLVGLETKRKPRLLLHKDPRTRFLTLFERLLSKSWSLIISQNSRRYL